VAYVVEDTMTVQARAGASTQELAAVARIAIRALPIDASS
jgi:FAD/FMN-containing dehydrogenase